MVSFNNFCQQKSIKYHRDGHLAAHPSLKPSKYATHTLYRYVANTFKTSEKPDPDTLLTSSSLPHLELKHVPFSFQLLSGPFFNKTHPANPSFRHRLTSLRNTGRPSRTVFALPGASDVSELLVRHGADIEVRDDTLRTPLKVAVESGVFPPRWAVSGAVFVAFSEGGGGAGSMTFLFLGCLFISS